MCHWEGERYQTRFYYLFAWNNEPLGLAERHTGMILILKITYRSGELGFQIFAITGLDERLHCQLQNSA